MPKLVIDGRDVEVPPGTNLIEAARAAGVDVPYFCYHPHLSIVGQCRICMVEIEGQPRLAIACATPATEGMVVRSETSERVREARNAVMEFLLANHPLDCPVCDQAGECLLQDHSLEQGTDSTHMIETRRTFPGYERRILGPHIVQNQNRCIHCSRCIRFTREISETAALTYKSRGNSAFIDTFNGRPLDDPMSGCVADVCPVGALTTREFRFAKRAWKLRSTASVCPGCSIGCNVFVEHHERVVYRFKPRSNPAINATWLCDHGRFLAESYNEQHWRTPHHRVSGELVRCSWGECLRALTLDLQAAGTLRVVASAAMTLEELYLARELFVRHLGGEMVVPSATGPERRMKNANGEWLSSTDPHPNTAGARKLGLRFVDERGLDRFLYGAADLTIVLDPDAHPFLASVEARRLLRASPTLAFVRTDHPVAEVASWLLPMPSLAAEEGTWISQTGAMQRFEAAFAPQGEARPLWQTLMLLGRELRVPALDFTTPADVLVQLCESEPSLRPAAKTQDQATKEHTHVG